MDSSEVNRRSPAASIVGRKNKNWNLFAGDLEYRTDCFLRFLSPFTAVRYHKDRFQRLLFQARALVWFTLVAWSFLFWNTTVLNFTRFLTGVGCLLAMYKTISIKWSPYWGKGMYLFVEFHLQCALSEYELSIFLTFFNLPCLLSGIFLVSICVDVIFIHEWYKHFLVSMTLLVIRSIFDEITLKLFCTQVSVIIVTTTLFGCIEKVMKEDWVLYDSFKKSFNLVKKCSDTIPYPVLILDHNGRIVKGNAQGKVLEKNAREENYKLFAGSFTDLLKPQCKSFGTSLLKSAFNERVSDVEVLFKIAKNKYEPYRITLEPIVWKGAKCLIATCRNSRICKVAHKLSFHSECAVREKAETVCRTIENVIENTGDKAKYRKLYYEAKQTYYRNENTRIISINIMNDQQPELESFDITEYLHYFLDFHSILAYENRITLTLKIDPCFPKEITGERIKFELILSNILSHLILNTEKDCNILLQAKLKHPNEDGLLLSFEFYCPISSSITLSQLEFTIGSSSPSDPLSVPEVVENQSFALIGCKYLIKWLKGNIEISMPTENTVGIFIDIPFANCSDRSRLKRIKPVGFFQTKKQNLYTTQWILPAGPMRITAEEEEKTVAKFPDPMRISAEEKEKAIPNPAGRVAIEQRRTIMYSLCRAKDESRERLKDLILKREKARKSVSMLEGNFESSRIQRAQTPEAFPKFTSENTSKCRNSSEGKNQLYVSASELASQFPEHIHTSESCFIFPTNNRFDESFSSNYSNNISQKDSASISYSSKYPKESYLGDNSEIRLASKRLLGKKSLQTTRTTRRRNNFCRDNSACSFKGIIDNPLRQRRETIIYQTQVKRLYKRKKWSKKDLASPCKEEYKKPASPKVLIVEDNYFNIVPIHTTLTRNRIEYDVAKNGLMAVERYNQATREGYKYGLILMDIEMPIMNGYEATEAIRNIEKSNKSSHTYICGLSGYTDKTVMQKCLEHGMDQYLPKPLNMEHMMAIIKDQFNKISRMQNA